VHEFPVDGAVYAQPLYVENLSVGDGSVHDVVLIATATNTVYAFDVYSVVLLWRRVLGPPDTSEQQLPYNALGCGKLSPGRVTGGQVEFFIGIQSTPVIDLRAQRIYVSYRLGGATDKEAQQRLAALALRDGSVVKDVQVAQHADFRIETQRQRPSLLLAGGKIFLAFGSRCEDPRPGGPPRYNGWIFVYDATTLHQFAYYNVTPTSAGGGIWQASSSCLKMLWRS
jgi:hypothetical protein